MKGMGATERGKVLGGALAVAGVLSLSGELTGPGKRTALNKAGAAAVDAGLQKSSKEIVKESVNAAEKQVAAKMGDDFVPNVPVGRRTKIGETGPDGIQPNGAGRHTPQHVNPPYQPVQNTPGSVNGIDYSGHAFDQMRNRGLVPSVVENALRTGTRTPGNTPGTKVGRGVSHLILT